MQNFENTIWENMTEEEVFIDNQKLVYSTIRKQFPNHKSFCATHMIEYDDLVQMGNIGLLNAIRSFKKDSKVLFRTYAINNIVWEIISQAKNDSLRNINTQTFEIVKMVSIDQNNNDDDNSDSSELSLSSVIPIPKEKEPDNIVGDSIVFEQAINFLKKDKEVDEELFNIFISRLKGESMETIAKRLGIHRNSVSGRLKTVKAQRIKFRLEDFLRNGAM